MIKILRVLVVSVLTLACLYVALAFFIGFPGYGRYSPKNMQRYPPPSVPNHAGEEESETNEKMTGTDSHPDSSQEPVTSRNS